MKDFLNHKRALVITGVYFICGVFWIYFSDNIVDLVAADKSELKIIQTYKGFFYIFVTSVLLYMLVLYFFHIQSAEYKSSIQTLGEKLKLEKELTEVSLMYESLVENMLDSVAHCRMIYKDGQPVDYEYLSVNKVFESMTGLSSVVGRTICELIPEYAVQNPDALKVFGEVASSGKPTKWEHYLKALGQWYSFSIYSPRKGEFIIIASDITEQKRTEQNLKDNENRLRTIIEIEPECVKIIDANGCLTYMNPAGLSMIDARLEQVRGKKVLGLISPEYKSAFSDMHKRVIAGEKVHLVFEMVGLKGIHRWLETTSVPMHTSEGVVLLGVTRDITERMKLEEDLKRTNEHLQEMVMVETEKRLEKEKLLIQQSKMAMMGEMIGAIAHQWRQPLNSLAITIQDVEMAYLYGELNKEYVKSYKESAMEIIKNMSKTIDDFRNFFKPNKERNEFELKEVVNETLNIMLPQLANHQIEVNFNQSSMSKVYSYKSELEQVLLIIISNAHSVLIDNKIKNPRIDILIESQNDGHAKLIIEDNGGGVPINIIDRIFEPYFTTKEQGKGTGIGLYMAKEIIERQMGGKIYCQNTDVGASFVIEI